jgi:hypothetical protein
MESADMTKDEALKLALEYIETNAHERRHVRWAIKEALAQPARTYAVVSGDDVPKRMKRWVSLHNIQASEFIAFHIGFCCGEDSVQPAQERYFCQRCGKPVNLTTIHTCTPPRGQA